MGMYDVDIDSYSGFSNDLNYRAKQALCDTWNRIAGDMLVDEHGQPDETASMTKEEVLEVVLDADHMADSDADAARYIIWLKRFHTELFNTVVYNAFPYKTYGY